MASLFPASVEKRLNRANWHAFALSQLTTASDLTRVKRWVKDNIAGDSYVVALKENIGNRRRTLATFVRIKEDDDAMLFQIQWKMFE